MSSPEEYQRISFWLVPEKKEFSFFQGLVHEIALKFAGPRFSPHVTEYVGMFSHAFPPEQVLEELKPRLLRPIVLKPSGLCFSEQFTKSCYLDLQTSDEIQAISKFIQERAMTPTDYCFRPHMSLFYGNLSPSDQENIKKLVIIPERMCFDSIWAVLNPPSVTKKEDIETWQTMCSIVLPH
jgi:hypothetical protein